MTMPDVLKEHLPAAQETLRTFVATLLGSEAPLVLEQPAPTTFAEEQSQAMAYLLVWSTAGPETDFAAAIEPAWVPLLSQSMLGERLEIGDSGYEEFVREVTRQAVAALQAHLPGLPQTTPALELRAPGSPLPEGMLPNGLWKVGFALNHGAQALRGYVLLPDPPPAPPAANPEPAPRASEPAPSVPSPAPAPAQATAAPNAPEAPPAEAPPAEAPVALSSATFPDLGPETITGDGGSNFNLLAEVELEITAELGRRRLPLSELMHLTSGSVIELEKLVDENLEIYANGRLIAEGKAVVVGDQFGIRITNLASAQQRAKAFL